MSTKYDFTVKNVGVAEDRTRDQYTVDLLYHPAGEPGLVYRAQVLAELRADTLNELQALVADFAWEHTP